MSNPLSIADRAVFTLSAVANMGENLTNDDACRHVVRGLKQVAQEAIEAGFRTALELSYQAEQIEKDFKAAQSS